jgi:hypothetical protein
MIYTMAVLATRITTLFTSRFLRPKRRLLTQSGLRGSVAPSLRHDRFNLQRSQFVLVRCWHPVIIDRKTLLLSRGQLMCDGSHALKKIVLTFVSCEVFELCFKV